MADKIAFSLVSPERELITTQVDRVDIPGTEGWIGILPNHTPMMTTLAPGIVVLKDGNDEQQFFVRGGFAEVSPSGLTVLAQEAMPVSELDAQTVATLIETAKSDLEAAGDNAEKSLIAQQTIDRLTELKTA